MRRTREREEREKRKEREKRVWMCMEWNRIEREERERCGGMRMTRI